MKFAVIGAGAIGGYLGTRLALAGEDVTFIARGANLTAIRSDGFTLIEEDGSKLHTADVKAATIDAPGQYDAILLALKAHQVPDVAAHVASLLGPQTSIVTLQNGVPWWFFYAFAGPYEGRPVKAVDPDGTTGANIPSDRIIGSVAYPAAELIAPGVVKVIEGNRFTLGEPNNAKTDRVRNVSEIFARAGLKSPISTDIRAEIWLKLWGNAVFNPISALTHATLVDICQFPAARALASAMMVEAQAVAEKLGLRVRVSIEKRIAGAEAVGLHKTSMLQDIEAGRAPELEALVGSVVELARLTGTPTPALDTVYACTKLLAKTLGDSHGRLAIQSI